jgi:ribosome-associated translation inhibitor RaiA
VTDGICLINPTTGFMMQIRINTDHHIDGREAVHDEIDGVVEHALRNVADHVTRLELHLADENGGKPGPEDKRCVIEARLEGRQPVAVEHHAASIAQAVDGAARKLASLLESELGRLDGHHHRSNAGIVE